MIHKNKSSKNEDKQPNNINEKEKKLEFFYWDDEEIITKQPYYAASWALLGGRAFKWIDENHKEAEELFLSDYPKELQEKIKK